MKIEHIMPNTNHNVSKSFIRFINVEFDAGKHRVFFLDEEERVSNLVPRYENVHFVGKSDIIDYLVQYDLLIFHFSFMLTTEH